MSNLVVSPHPFLCVSLNKVGCTKHKQCKLQVPQQQDLVLAHMVPALLEGLTRFFIPATEDASCPLSLCPRFYMEPMTLL